MMGVSCFGCGYSLAHLSRIVKYFTALTLGKTKTEALREAGLGTRRHECCSGHWIGSIDALYNDVRHLVAAEVERVTKQPRPQFPKVEFILPANRQ